jgi:hypothetical protein
MIEQAGGRSLAVSATSRAATRSTRRCKPGVERFGRLGHRRQQRGHRAADQADAATKHGLIGLTKSTALNYAASNIRINAICPGIVDTEMMRRFTGDTDEGPAAVIAREPIGRIGRPGRDRGRGSVALLRRSSVHDRSRHRRRRRPDRLNSHGSGSVHRCPSCIWTAVRAGPGAAPRALRWRGGVALRLDKPAAVHTHKKPASAGVGRCVVL